ncbi:hypothetical protein I8H83_02975 [Candidatus Saccharibacteria bacterium]|nr:hypothetical protein [Candidatus Saccharibacteria bacterium]MBH2007540.1 hypothetical protein [Candidatus Saccharibacteria bacterium]
MSFETLPVQENGELTHVKDLVEADRLESRRRLEFITAKLGQSALVNEMLGEGLDDLLQDSFELAA